MDRSNNPRDAWGEVATPVSKPLSSRKEFWFRVIVVTLPIAIGAVSCIWILLQWKVLVMDRQTGRVHFQSPPIYLEEPGHEVTGHRYMYDQRLGWRNIPNWKATSRGRKLTINSQGLRDRESPVEKPDGLKRILVLGDSFAWGYGVSDEAVFCEVLEQRLYSGGNHYEVINTGVSGWGTDQQYLYLIEEGFHYSPDIVVVAFFLKNDTTNNVYSKEYGLHKPVFLDTDLKLGNVPVPKPTVKTPEFKSDVQPVDITAAIFRHMLQACSEHGCRLVVMKFGRFLDPSDRRMATEEQLLDKATQHYSGAEYLDLDKEFVALGISKQQLIEGNDDGHWNEFGHRQVAKILHDFLIEKSLIQGK